MGAQPWKNVIVADQMQMDAGYLHKILTSKPTQGLAGRIRWMILTPTRSMAADALTKPMLSKQMMMILTSGVLEMQNKETHHIQMKRLPPKYEIEEQDLETEDPVLLQK